MARKKAKKKSARKKSAARSRGTVKSRKRPATKSRGKGKRLPRKRAKVAPPQRKRKRIRKGTKKRAPVKRRLDEIRKAERVLERPEGTDQVAETNWLTPTKRGFDIVENIMREALAEHPGPRSATVEVWHYSLYITFTGPNGQVVNDKTEGAGLPLLPWIPKNYKGKREQVIQTARALVRTEVYALLSKHFNVISPGRAPKSEKMTENQAAKKLREIREGRNTRFKFILFRTSVKPAKRKKRGRK